MPSLAASRNGRLLVSLLLAGAWVTVSRPASARLTFPGIIENEYALDCAPPCTICHTSPSGGTETATQPFVVNLGYAAQRTSNIVDSNLVQVLTKVATQPCENLNDRGCKPVMGVCTGICDANGDGTGDVAQLSKGIDPNTAQKLFCVTYGCGGAHVAPKLHGRRFDGTAALAALGALVVLAGRFRRKRAS